MPRNGFSVLIMGNNYYQSVPCMIKVMKTNKQMKCDFQWLFGVEQL